MEYNREKLKELMLYVANRSLDDPSFGATKLNKVLFFSDFLAYASLGHAITGAEYQKLRYGPAPRQLKPVQRDLENEGAATLLPKPVSSFTQHRLVALREPNLDLFTAEEIALVDEVIAVLRSQTAVSVSDLSHRWSIGWAVAEEGETIPYATVFLTRPEPGDPNMARAEEIAEKLGLLTR